MFTKFFEDRSLRWAAAAGLAAIVIIALLLINPIYFAVGSLAVLWFYDITNTLFALTSAILALLLWRSFRQGEVLKVIWGSLGLGLLLWATGEAIWGFFELSVQGELPYPSVADVVFVVGYIPLFIALFLRYRTLRTPPVRGWLVGTFVAFVVLVVMAMVFVIGPIVTYRGYERPIEQVLDALYPLGDLAVALGALLIVLVLSGGALSVPWMVIATGFLVVSVADLLFSYATWNEVYLAGSNAGVNLITALSDVPYYASYVILAFGIYTQARLQKPGGRGTV